MRRRDLIGVILALVPLLTWALVLNQNDFKGNNGLIIARSFSIVSTIDGQVENIPPLVGTRVSPHDLLVQIHNPRFDHGRLSELESQSNYFQREIARLEFSQKELLGLLSKFKKKSKQHGEWMLQDSTLRTLENQKQLAIAEKIEKLKVDQAQRMALLFSDQFASNVALSTAKTEAEIAIEMVSLNRTQLQRNQNLQQTLKRAGTFFENGDASYWDRMIDSLLLKSADNSMAVATLNSQLMRTQDQVHVERARIGYSAQEDHHAPFEGLVNATYISQGSKVNSGTTLLQVLDCSNPVVIVPIPELSISDFTAGMDVTVHPVNTDDEIRGVIKYISSGPLIGHDDTLLVQDDLTIRGVHAVINFLDDNIYVDSSQPCESVHRAVVIIHTKSKKNGLQDWLASLF